MHFPPRPCQSLSPWCHCRPFCGSQKLSRCGGGGFFQPQVSNTGFRSLLSSEPSPSGLPPFPPIQPPANCTQEKAAQAQGCLNPGQVGRWSGMVDAGQSGQEWLEQSLKPWKPTSQRKWEGMGDRVLTFCID